jgi:hypothetical protein
MARSGLQGYQHRVARRGSPHGTRFPFRGRKILGPFFQLHPRFFPLVPKLQLGNALPGKLQLPSCYS